MTDVFFDRNVSLPSRLNVSTHQGKGLTMRVHPVPQTCRLGSLRTSVASFVIDALAGIAVDGDDATWTFTSQMSVRMPKAPAPAYVEGRAAVLRQGARSATCEVTLVDEVGRGYGYGVLSFVRVARRDGDPEKHVFNSAAQSQRGFMGPPIERPLPEEMGIKIIDGSAGAVEVVVQDKLRNPSGAMQGAMVACVAEVAAEEVISARYGRPVFVSDLDVRYLSQIRVGPVRTTSTWLGDEPGSWVRVELHDVTSGVLLTHALARATLEEYPERGTGRLPMRSDAALSVF
jgi:acyl-coenzyme A thioesterase PaaI-like protein